ncbi:MAG: hypothetical protein QNJ85_10195 [Gammaproteobacteria bacterium]|nr:hypothetical protein [Gammaproteobacteria bacterium]
MTPRFAFPQDTGRPARLLLCALLCLAVAGTPRADESAALELAEIGFFEGGVDQDPPEWGSPELADSFERDHVRYIYTMLNLKNNLWQQREQDVRLQVRYYAPDGSLFGDPVIEHRVPADWEYADLWTGWGWETKSHWESGPYKVEIWDQNQGLIAQKKFSITPAKNVPVPSATAGVNLDRMAFFAGDEGNEGPPEDWGDSRLRNRYAQEDTRFVYTLVSLENLQWQQREQDVVIHLRYYLSNGELYANPIIDYRVPADWEYAELWNGWGWSSAGKWKRDRYRVELWLDNRRKIGESHFEIY